jgi:hypothetical protein
MMLSSIVIVNQRTGQQQFSLQRSAHQLAQDIRVAQEMAMSSRECKNCNATPAGYGIFFRDIPPNDSFYIIYADTQENECYTLADDTVKTIKLETGIVIVDININSIDANRVSINFKPPDPLINIKRNPGDSGNTVTEITLALSSNPSMTKTITVNTAGLIDID